MFWHDIVSCGIGGRTVAEAKESLSYQEAHDWMIYRAETGSLNVLLRIENLLAHMLSTTINIHSKKKVKASEFLPFMRQHERVFGVGDADDWDKFGV